MYYSFIDEALAFCSILRRAKCTENRLPCLTAHGTHKHLGDKH